ncbi:hypothetical protein TSOC_006817 [Tetrabaena socialis]|uniref:Uncharacterized protein n=1 Tax=Tetrabaena socialis TaxID=47790 RepID=A0A2J8A2K4_9CHLO|nr:hypothetical protein TSOC_006817 [Tetrabaena socialis]|eukprot:PNH06752.1 hypothetical protein TSOC_006817 [Tetrabaena socialis]
MAVMGRIFAYLSLPVVKAAKGSRSTFNAVSRVLIMCKHASGQCEISLGDYRVLHFTKSRKREKNWCPLNGTSLMAYPVHGSFARGFFNWSNYDAPVPHRGFTTTLATEEFFTQFEAKFRGIMTFSGGTPAILEDSGETYLAVGHLRASSGCFHMQGLPRRGHKPLGPLMKNVPATCGQLVALAEAKGASAAMTRLWFPQAFKYSRFSASPPYHITHISHSFIPYSPQHYGVVFPLGLERLGARFLVSYGDSDQSAKLLVFEAAAINAALLPLDSLESDVAAYQMCSLPCWSEGGACL